MDEEQAVLDFFSQPENLSLGLSVAEKVDAIRVQLNNQFWLDLLQRMNASITQKSLPWLTSTTEDKNAHDCVVGIYFTPKSDQQLYLRPMMEQQYLGNTWQIYFGLMWSTPPTAQQLAIPAVQELRQLLQNRGFKDNDNFLAWQWTKLYPRRSDFLLRLTQQPDDVLQEAEDNLAILLTEFQTTFEQANDALKVRPNSLDKTLTQLRKELID
ncbi:MAG: hypothetical protein R8M11_05400 [Gallionella sp.]